MSLIEKIAAYIPGYRGYKLKEVRRETDRVIRSKIANLIRSSKEDFENFCFNNLKEISKDSELRALYDNIRFMYDKTWQKIDKAEAGYSGLFDLVKVREDKLDEVIKYDSQLIDVAQNLKKETSELNLKAFKAEEIKSEMNRILNLLRDLEDKIDSRTNILHELGEMNA